MTDPQQRDLDRVCLLLRELLRAVHPLDLPEIRHQIAEVQRAALEERLHPLIAGDHRV